MSSSRISFWTNCNFCRKNRSSKASAHSRRPLPQKQQLSRRTTRLQINRLTCRIRKRISRVALKDLLRRDSFVRAAIKSIPCGNAKNSWQCLSPSVIEPSLKKRFVTAASTSSVILTTANPRLPPATLADAPIQNRIIVCCTASVAILHLRDRALQTMTTFSYIVNSHIHGFLRVFQSTRLRVDLDKASPREDSNCITENYSATQASKSSSKSFR